jgi:acyl-CoA thioesterase II
MSEDIPQQPLDDPSAHPDALLRILDLETLDRDLFRSTFVFADRYALYGGQVAAQALIAAGRTVAPDRPPHSLHGYFLSSGDASRPTMFHVYRDRDGRTYSARRVVAVQNGEVIFNMSASFHGSDAGPDEQVVTMLEGIAPPEESEPFDPMRLFSYDARLPPSEPTLDFPRLFWARATVPLPDDALVHAAVLTYLSDISSGLMSLHSEHARSTSSLDHAVWFHRPVRADEWVLSDLRPHSAAEGRGWYTGSMFDRGGRLVASLAQEALFRFSR